ncbi:MAG: LysM peptidoglycan-binding domain-containing protein [Aggregatilineales bacterium]
MQLRRISMYLCATLVLISGFAFGASAQTTTEVPETTPEPTVELVIIDLATATPATQPLETYVVQSGDTLFRIAVRFNTTTTALAAENGITNPRLIVTGQVLRIPGTTTTEQAPTPVTTPEIGTTSTYTVIYGDTLFRIAIRFNTTVTELRQLNGLSSADVIFAGQVLTVPDPNAPIQVDQATVEPIVEITPTAPPAEATEIVTVTEEPAVSEDPVVVEAPALPNEAFGYGVEAFMIGQDVAQLTDYVDELGVDWVKVRVEWRDIEAEPASIEFTELDAIVNALDSQGLNIMFTVTNAPDWARERFGDDPLNENAPPQDLTTFEDFMTALTDRYSGTVDAYQIWDEPNIRRNWSCQINLGTADNPRVTTGMCQTNYIDLLTVAYNAIKAIDPQAQVITAGLAPTGFNDGINAIADRDYLQGLYNEGVIAVSDAIGVHPGGWANPPDALCCDAAPGVETHYENPIFYFLETLRAYHDIMLANGDTRPMWVTSFGWGTGQDTDFPSEANIFVTYTSLSEQAIYVPRAYEIGMETGYVGPMFLDNLNGCQGLAYRVEACYNSLIAPDGSLRPVFGTVSTSIGGVLTEEPTDEPLPEATPDQ